MIEEKGLCCVLLFFIFGVLINLILGQVLIKYGFKGLNYLVVIVCLMGVYVIGDVVCLIKYGLVDVMVVGGVEVVICKIGIVGFNVCKVLLIKCVDDLQVVSCLYDVDCDGFVMGEGVGIVVLEEYEYVKVCGVKIYVEVLGYGLLGDVYYIIVLSEDGEGGEWFMCVVLVDVGLELVDIDYINVYGILIMVDIIEFGVVEWMMGDVVLKVIMLLIKFMMGYLLGVVGVIEVIFLVLVICDQVVLLMINLDNLVVEIIVDLVLNVKCEWEINVVLFNLFGFGGINVSVIFGKLS